MSTSQTCETIAQYLHHTKPPSYRPGIDVGMSQLDEDTMIVFVPPLHTIAVIRYMHGPDLFSVTISDATPHVRDYDGVYCDQLGELVYGADADAFTQPTVQIFVMNDDGTPGAEIASI